MSARLPVNSRRRFPVSMVCAIATGGYLAVAVVLSAVPVPHALGAALLVLVAIAAGACGREPAAVGVGMLGWLFYSGFVTHTHGQLGFDGTDRYVAPALVLAALTASYLAGIPHRGRESRAARR